MTRFFYDAHLSQYDVPFGLRCEQLAMEFDAASLAKEAVAFSSAHVIGIAGKLP